MAVAKYVDKVSFLLLYIFVILLNLFYLIFCFYQYNPLFDFNDTIWSKATNLFGKCRVCGSSCCVRPPLMCVFGPLDGLAERSGFQRSGNLPWERAVAACCAAQTAIHFFIFSKLLPHIALLLIGHNNKNFNSFFPSYVQTAF